MRPATAAQRGFSLLEVLISMVILLVVTSAIYGLLAVARSNVFTVDQRTTVLQNLRSGLNTVGRDALNAGVGFQNEGASAPDDFLGADLDTDPDLVTAVVPGNDRNDVDGVLTDEVSFLYQDETFNNDAAFIVNPLTVTVDSGSTTITVNGPATNAACRAGDIYIVSNGSNRRLGWLKALQGTAGLDFAAGDPLGLNAADMFSSFPNGSPASLSRIRYVQFLVQPSRVLVRREFGNPANRAGVGVVFDDETPWLDMPLAQGVRDLQIQYVMADGTVVDSPAAPAGVRQVRFTVTVDSPEPDPHTGEPTTLTLSSTFSTRNLGYEER